MAVAGENVVGTVGHDVDIPRHLHHHLPSDFILHCHGRNGRPGPQTVHSHVEGSELLSPAVGQQRHAVLADRVGWVVFEPLTFHVEWGTDVKYLRVGGLLEVG